MTDDTNPWDGEGEEAEKDAAAHEKKPSMGFLTALSLSLNNLLTKKGRTFLTAFAGSIGIIGIALILSVSSGVNRYISRVEEDTLSSYPIQLDSVTMDAGAMMEIMMGGKETDSSGYEEGRIYANPMMNEMMSTMSEKLQNNNLELFKVFLETTEEGKRLRSLTSDIKYGYKTPLTIYREIEREGTGEKVLIKSNPCEVFNSFATNEEEGSSSSSSNSMMSSGMMSMNVWTELMDNKELLALQYDVLTGRLPESYDEAVLIVSSKNELSDYTLYATGLMDPAGLQNMMMNLMTGRKIEMAENVSYSFEEAMGMEFFYIPQALCYEFDGKVWKDHSGEESVLRQQITDGNAVKIRIVGIIRPSENAVGNTMARRGGIGYLSSLKTYAVQRTQTSPVVQAQMATPDVDILTGRPFAGAVTVQVTKENLSMFIDMIPEEQKQRMKLDEMSEDEILALIKRMQDAEEENANTLHRNLTLLGVADLNVPSTIRIYPRSFEAKDEIEQIIARYNEQAGEENAIRYTDYVGLLMSSITTIIDAITYVLIAFVAISLIVSSIMIGIITYISVLERTKEIGILRAIGASKRDVSRVFNAETLIVGFVAGLIGILVTLLFVAIVNVILYALTQISGLAFLPPVSAAVLIGISMLLTFIAGLIPSRIAAKKDPVVALRSE